MTESKAREFWIVARSAFHDSRAHENENLIRKYHQYIRHSEVVHVIEKSAYDEMTSQRDDFWKQIQRLEQNCTDFRDKKDQLQAELEALKVREIAHLALIQDLQKGIKTKDGLLRECVTLIERFDPDDCFTFDNDSDDLRDEVVGVLQKLREVKSET